MKSWAKLCDIVSLNFKNENLVVVVTTRFFINDQMLPKFKGLTLNVVPPELDLPRTITIKSANIKDGSTNKIEFYIEENFECQELRGKSLLIDMEVAKNIFGDMLKDDNLTGRVLYDKNIGEIGKVIDFGGTKAQKHLVIDFKGHEIYVPFVDEIITSVDDDKITADLPAGLLEVNEV